MSEAWLHFSVVIFVQLIFFVAYASFEGRLKEIPKILLHGISIGIVIGLLYDLVLGKYFGLVSYALGFGIPFMVTNAALSYGLFVASCLLLQRSNTIHFITWLSLLIVVYETANHFFTVWAYEFSLPLILLFVLLLVGYSSGALLASVIAKLVFKYQFIFNIENEEK